MPMSADASELPPRDARDLWFALTATQPGAAHLAAGLPNQDAVAACQVRPDVLVAAVADGGFRGGDDDAAVQERVGHRHRGFQDAARVVAEVKHQTFERGAVVLAQILESRVQIIAGRFAELGYARVPKPVLEELSADAVQLDLRTLYRKEQRFGMALAHDAYLDG